MAHQVDFDEQVGDWLRRGDKLWIAPPRTPLPEIDEEPADPWFYVGTMPEGYEPKVERPRRVADARRIADHEKLGPHGCDGRCAGL